MRVFLGLGSNLGNRKKNLLQAVQRLAVRPGIEVKKLSSIYESEPWGPPQPCFLNAALEVQSELSPLQLLAEVKLIERELGRFPGGVLWGPRTLDIDLLLADRIVAEPALLVPHRYLHKRIFALLPLCDIVPGLMHPVFGKSIEELRAELENEGIRKVGEFGI